MIAKCVGCGLHWSVSVLAKIPESGYTCPLCDSRRRAGEPLKNERPRPPREEPAQCQKLSMCRKTSGPRACN